LVLVILAIVLCLIVAAVLLFFYSMGKPLNEPGMVRQGEGLRSSLVPPAQSGDQSYYVQRGCGKSTRPIDRFSSPNFYADMKMLDKTLGLDAQIADYADFRKRYFDFSHMFTKSEADLVALDSEFPRYYGAALRARNLTPPARSGVNENGGWMVFAMYMSMGKRHDYRQALRSVKAPVRVVHGELDLQPEKLDRLYAECFPNSSFEVAKGAGHFMYDEQPQAFS
jgi:hypothetical protein